MRKTEELANEVVADYFRRIDNGEEVDVYELIAKYPDHARDLRSFFEMDAVLADLNEADTNLAPAGSTVSNVPALPDGFVFVKILGRGGMGVVYGALQKSPQRKVALKVLGAGGSVTDTRLAMARFRREAEISSSLTARHVLPVFDVLEHLGNPYIVMPWIDGSDLGNIITVRGLSRGSDECQHDLVRRPDSEYVTSLLQVFDQALEALVAIHDQGIIHRDIKPSNILVDSQNSAWLTDFGLARVVDCSGLTANRDVLGTRGYLSPEAYVGVQEVDNLSDVFSMGVTIYQALALVLPYGKALISTRTPLPVGPSDHQPLLSPRFDRVILRAIDPDRTRRYSSASEFLEDWQRARRDLRPYSRTGARSDRISRWLGRRKILIGSCLSGLVILGLGYQLIPSDSQATGLEVEVPTSPEAVRGVLIPKNRDGNLDLDNPIHSDEVRDGALVFRNIAPGDYFVAVKTDDGRFHEVYRTVPGPQDLPITLRHRNFRRISDTKIRVHTIDIPPASVTDGMRLFKGSATFSVGTNDPKLPHLKAFVTAVAPFYMDAHEATVNECTALDSQVAGDLKGSPDASVTNVSHDFAVAYAELLGKRLPTEFEYEFAATRAGTQQFPWGDNAELATPESFATPFPAEHDVLEGVPPVKGLFSGVSEWTASGGAPYPSASSGDFAIVRSTPDFHQQRIIRGGTFNTALGRPEVNAYQLARGPRHRYADYRTTAYQGLGFRCVRSFSPTAIP